MDSIDLIDGMDGLEREEGFSLMLGAAVLDLCSFSRTAGRSLIRMVRAGVSAGPVRAGGAEGSAGAAAVCGCTPPHSGGLLLGCGSWPLAGAGSGFAGWRAAGLRRGWRGVRRSRGLWPILGPFLDFLIRLAGGPGTLMGQQLVHGPAPGPLHLIDGLDLGAAALRLALVELLDVFILQELGRLLCGNGGL